MNLYQEKFKSILDVLTDEKICIFYGKIGPIYNAGSVGTQDSISIYFIPQQKPISRVSGFMLCYHIPRLPNKCNPNIKSGNDLLNAMRVDHHNGNDISDILKIIKSHLKSGGFWDKLAERYKN